VYNVQVLSCYLADFYNEVIMVVVVLTLVGTGLYVLLLIFLYSFFRRIIAEVPLPIATKLFHMLGSECTLRNWVRNNCETLLLKVLSPKPWTLRSDLRQLPDLTANNARMEEWNGHRWSESALRTTFTPLGGDIILFT